MARQNPQGRRSLRDRLAWDSTLFQAFFEVTGRANPKSAGPDNVTVGAFRRDVKSQIKRLQAELKDGRYSPSLPRGVAIPKDSKRGAVKGNVRSISVFNVRDRIIQRALSNLIWPRLRGHVYSEVSFGGIRRYSTRKGSERTSTDVRKNVKAAAERILTLRRDGYVFTFETDIRDFYPSIKKPSLLADVLQCLAPDDSIAELLARAIDKSVINLDDLDSRGLSEYWDAAQGVPQGGVLSPLFANFYLASFDRTLVDKGFQPVRYVDDLVVPTRTFEEAERAYHFCREYLASLDLEIHGLDEEDVRGRVKTRIRRSDQYVDFLGLRFEGTKIRPTPKKIDELVTKIKLTTDAFRDGATLVSIVTDLNRQLKGWMAAYSFCDMSPETLRRIDHTVGTRVISWMQRHGLSKARSLSKEQRQKIGFWSVFEHQLSPLSKRVFSSERQEQLQHCQVIPVTSDAPF